MTESDIVPAGENSLSRDFVDHTRQLLEHLYDLPFLQQHFFASPVAPPRLQDGEMPSQLMRRTLVEAIEALKPPAGVAPSTPQSRVYNVVSLHYIDGMTIQETAHQLDISLRQAYRDLQRGVESIAGWLWERWQAAAAGDAPAQTSVDAEVERLAPRFSTADLTALVAYAQKAVQRLAEQKAVHLEALLPANPILVSTDPSVAQQLLVHLFSQIVQQTHVGRVSITIAERNDAAEISIAYAQEADSAETILRTPLISQLLPRLKWSVTLDSAADGMATLRLSMRTDMQTIVVIDDNEGLVELLDRYLTGYPYKLVAAADGFEGLRLCHELRPAMIVLDVMMPEMDGWEVLQRLSNSPDTAHIPVIISSVFNDPALAASLGASAFLPKPIKRDDLLATLHRLAHRLPDRLPDAD